MTSLEGWDFTIKLYPLEGFPIIPISSRRDKVNKKGASPGDAPFLNLSNAVGNRAAHHRVRNFVRRWLVFPTRHLGSDLFDSIFSIGHLQDLCGQSLDQRFIAGARRRLKVIHWLGKSKTTEKHHFLQFFV